MSRRWMLLGMALHAAYAAALVGAAIAIYIDGHKEPSAPLADWAAMDAAFSTVIAGALVLLAGLHVVAAIAWFGNPANRLVLATSLPLVAYLIIVWFAYVRTDLIGWQFVVTGIVAAGFSGIAVRRRRTARTG